MRARVPAPRDRQPQQAGQGEADDGRLEMSRGHADQRQDCGDDCDQEHRADERGRQSRRPLSGLLGPPCAPAGGQEPGDRRERRGDQSGE
ncbi:MAG: hypothetical protein ACLP4R_30650 [Solirubrobacteraceae bacterium]